MNFLLAFLLSAPCAAQSPQRVLRARQAVERQQLAADLDARWQRLRESQENDQDAFERRQRQDREDFASSLRQEVRSFEESAKGQAMPDRKRLRRELGERQKQRRRDFERGQRVDRKKFYANQHEQLEAERLAEQHQRQQLEDAQRLQVYEIGRH